MWISTSDRSSTLFQTGWTSDGRYKYCIFDHWYTLKRNHLAGSNSFSAADSEDSTASHSLNCLSYHFLDLIGNLQCSVLSISAVFSNLLFLQTIFDLLSSIKYLYMCHARHLLWYAQGDSESQYNSLPEYLLCNFPFPPIFKLSMQNSILDI